MEQKIDNWKIQEVMGSAEIFFNISEVIKFEILRKSGFPLSRSVNGLDRTATELDWSSMEFHYSFTTYNDLVDKHVSHWLRESQIFHKEYLYLFYNNERLILKVKNTLFISDWEDFFFSAMHNMIVLSEDTKLICEMTRDMVLHSNFRIHP
jgi:hypothetical protein